ncbi:hypothetical protein KCU87_g342, partial [Aureobasidium melanogenum]
MSKSMLLRDSEGTKPCCQMSATCSLFCFDHCNALTFVSLALSSITSVQAAPANQFHQYHHEYRQPLFMARADLNVPASGAVLSLNRSVSLRILARCSTSHAIDRGNFASYMAHCFGPGPRMTSVQQYLQSFVHGISRWPDMQGFSKGRLSQLSIMIDLPIDRELRNTILSYQP